MRPDPRPIADRDGFGRRAFLRSTSGRRRGRGFTIIELLVAAGITAFLAAFVAVIIRNVSTTWTRTSGRLSADAQARLILDQLAVDLQGAIFRDDGNVWFAANVLDRTTNSGIWQSAFRNPKPSGAPLSLAMTSRDIANARFGQAGVWLRFFTTRRGLNTPTSAATSVDTASAPVAVSYQIVRRYTATNSANTTSQAYLLHRSEVRPASRVVVGVTRPGVLESGYKIDGAPYTTNNTNANNASVTGDPRTIRTPGTSTGIRNLDSVIADNVIDFGVRCYVRDAAAPGGLRLIFPATDTGALSNNATTSRVLSSLPSNLLSTDPNFAQLYNQVFPDVVDVMVRILSEEGARLIDNIERNQNPAPPIPLKYNGNAQQWWWGVAQENSRVYTRRIVLNTKPL